VCGVTVGKNFFSEHDGFVVVFEFNGEIIAFIARPTAEPFIKSRGVQCYCCN